MAKKELPGGCLYRRGKRWWFKLQGRFYPCKPDGATMATPIRAVAVIIARRIWERHHAEHTAIADITARWHKADSLGCGAAHAEQRRRIVEDFAKSMAIEAPADITPASITDYMAKLAEPHQRRPKKNGKPKLLADSRKTIANKRADIGRFCQWLVEQGELLDNPTRQTRPPKVKSGEPIHLTRIELAQALKTAKKLKLWAVFFAAFTGARLGEIRRLTWGDVRNGQHGPIIVLRETKSGKPRSIPVNRTLAAVIAIMTPGEPGETIFPPRGPRWWNRSLNPIRKAVPKIGRAGGGWHDFRRTVGSLLVQAGTPIYTVAKVLGHSNVTTTARYYAHLDAEAGRDALEAL